MSQHDFGLVRSYAIAGGRVLSFFVKCFDPTRLQAGRLHVDLALKFSESGLP
jgi:hypothetical protein